MPKTPTLTDADVVELLDCAARGIFYWAARCNHDEEAKTYRVIARGDDLEPGEKPADGTVSYDQVRAAFTALAETGKIPAWQLREIEKSSLGFDNALANEIVQQALFGRLVFH